MRFGSLDIPAIFADGRAIVELKTATGAFDPSGKSPIDRYLRIPFSNGSRRKLLPDVDAFGCLRSLRARSALDGVSWVQGG